MNWGNAFGGIIIQVKENSADFLCKGNSAKEKGSQKRAFFCFYPVEHAAGNTLELYRAPARARARHEDQIASKTFPGTCWAIILYRISY